MRRPRRLVVRHVLAGAVLLAALGVGNAARAAAGEWQAGGRLGTAWLSRPGLGLALDAFVRRGMTPSIDLDLQVFGSFHPFQLGSKSQAATSERATPWALGITPGVSFRWDVFRVVPYAGVGLGFYSWDRAVTSSAGGQFGASGHAGLDYLLSRSVVLSVQASAHVVTVDGLVPWLQIGVGAAHAWGW